MIKSAAVLKDGRLYTGKNHGDIFRRMIVSSVGIKGKIEGFVTDDGSFVTRVEAAKIAYECGQIKKPQGSLSSYDLIEGGD